MCQQFPETFKSRKKSGFFSAKALKTSIRHKELTHSSYFWEQERADFVSEVWQRAKSCNQFHFLINERSTGESQPEALGTAERSDMTERLLEGARLSLCLSLPSPAAPAQRRRCQPGPQHGRAPRKSQNTPAPAHAWHQALGTLRTHGRLIRALGWDL